MLGTREKHWIAKCGTLTPLGFNETKGGQTGTIASHTEAAKLLMSQNRKGKGTGPRSDEARRNMSEAFKGRTPPNKGKPTSEETKRKISEAQKKRFNKDGI